MSNGRQYGGWDVMVEALGPIHERHQRVAGKPETSAGFTSDGRQITEYDQGLIEKSQLLPWAKEKMEEHTGVKWITLPDGREQKQRVQNLELENPVPTGWPGGVNTKRPV